MSDPKKIAATMAVLKLLQKEKEEASLYSAAIFCAQKTTSPWAMSGRQSLMQTRQIMQLKGFHKR